MTATTPGLHEGRLRAMIDPNSLADWGLNDEDRAAIAWALDALTRVKAERDEIRHELCNARSQTIKLQYDLENVCSVASHALERSRRATP